jgi:hypothetical protein
MAVLFGLAAPRWLQSKAIAVVQPEYSTVIEQMICELIFKIGGFFHCDPTKVKSGKTTVQYRFDQHAASLSIGFAAQTT